MDPPPPTPPAADEGDPYRPPVAALETSRGPVELDLAGPGPRAAAAFVDVGIILGAWFVSTVALGSLGVGAELSSELARLTMYVGLLGALVLFAIMEASPWSASPGKLLAGLRVVQLDGRPATIVNAFLRSFVKAFVLVCCCWVLGFFILLEPGSGPWDSAVGTRVVHKR